MRKYSFYYVVVALLSVLIFGAAASCFAGAGDIKARMQERLPTIVQLKDAGNVGENNKGYLEVCPECGAPKDAGTVSAENSDREAVYNAIAKQQGTTPQLVGERRALQIRQNASSGEWLQDPSGKWYKK